MKMALKSLEGYTMDSIYKNISSSILACAYTDLRENLEFILLIGWFEVS